MAKNEFMCDCKPINEEVVKEVAAKMLSDKTYEAVASFFMLRRAEGISDTEREYGA